MDIVQVTNFVPGYLARADGCLWEVYDEEDYVVNKFNWDEGKHTLLNLFGTSIQHPEDHFVQYFCGTKPTLIERGSPRRLPRKNPPETDNTDGRRLSSLVSPERGGADLPGQVGAQEDNDQGQEGQGGEDENVAGQHKGEKETGQGDVCPSVAINKTASPRCSLRKILQKLTMTKEEDCQVLNLLDIREQICQFKEHLTRIMIMAERFRAG